MASKASEPCSARLAAIAAPRNDEPDPGEDPSNPVSIGLPQDQWAESKRKRPMVAKLNSVSPSNVGSLPSSMTTKRIKLTSAKTSMAVCAGSLRLLPLTIPHRDTDW